jgi:hypothetical protein
MKKFGNATLAEWRTWLEEELTPPYSELVGSHGQVKYVLKSFLDLVSDPSVIAAPELLEACKQVVAWVDASADVALHSSRAIMATEYCRRTVNKAEGKS